MRVALLCTLACAVVLAACKTPEQKCAGHGADAFAACVALCNSGSGYGCSSAVGMVLMEDGTTKTEAKYVEYSQRACDLGQTMSCYTLGVAYKLGNNAPKDLGKAAALLKRACDGGVQEACESAKTLGHAP